MKARCAPAAKGEPLTAVKVPEVRTLMLLVLLAACGCSKGGPAKVNGPGTTTAPGLQYWDLTVGSGATAIPGKVLKMHYTGWLTNGTKFDSSLDHNQPFQFVLGTGRVIKGWEEGVAGMKVEGERQLRIPPDLAYGARAPSPTILRNSTLIFDVELVDVR